VINAIFVLFTLFHLAVVQSIKNATFDRESASVLFGEGLGAPYAYSTRDHL
jgi:hypothetical protein